MTSRPEASRTLLPAIALLAGFVYARSAPHWILGGDNGEFSTLFATGGIAHPPGYPTLVLWMRLWHWLPVASAAYGAALTTALVGALGVWALSRACLAWGASVPATAITTAIYAFSPLAWKMSSHAEVHAMNACFTAAILWLSAPPISGRADGLRPLPRIVALGLLAGVAIGAHQSIVFLAPIGLLAAARAARDAPRPPFAAIAGVVALLAGVVPPYVYVYVVARTSDLHTTPMWIDGATLGDVLFDFRRGAYGTLSLSSIPVERAPVGHLWLFATTVTEQTLGMPLVVLVFGANAVFKRSYRGVARPELASWAALVLSFILAGPVFVASFNLPFVGAGPQVVERFYLMPEVILTVLAARSFGSSSRVVLRDGLAAGLTVLAALAALLYAAPEVREHNRATVALYIENTLRGAPPNAIIVGTGDHRWGGFLYARYVSRLRPDVVCIVPAMLKQPWYRKDAQELTGVSFDTPSHTAVGPVTLRDRLLATGRPVLYTDWPDPAVEKTRHYSVGTLMRVLREGESPPSPAALEALNRDTFASYELEASPPVDPHGWGYGVAVDYARAWGELGAAYAAAGDIAREQECYRRAGQLAPWLVSAE